MVKILHEGPEQMEQAEEEEEEEGSMYVDRADSVSSKCPSIMLYMLSLEPSLSGLKKL